MRKYKRIFLIVVDSMGIGDAPDAADFGDAGADTLGHIAETVGTFLIPHLNRLGISKIKNLPTLAPAAFDKGYALRLREKSAGKDTMTGHWEMMGIHTTKPFITFTDTGFPEELIEALEKESGRKVIGNKAASGTEILDELAEQEINDHKMIVYTSADSVLQICGNEETFGLDELYRICEYARRITMRDEWRVGRVIARPYLGRRPGEFVRTPNRRDYALKPPEKTVLNVLAEGGKDVIAVGKIEDIFDGYGITEAVHSRSSIHGMEQTIDYAGKDWEGICFTNLVDFDALWGHRRNVQGYAQELVRFDVKLGEFLRQMRPDDLLMVTADHGNDPTYTGTDHTREKVPLLMYSPSMTGSGVLPEAENFGVIGATIAENFGLVLPDHLIGTSLLDKLMKTTCRAAEKGRPL